VIGSGEVLSYESFQMRMFDPRIAVIFAVICGVLAWTSSHGGYAEERPVKIVALGDSLTAGYGLPAADAFPAKLEQALRKAGQAVVVVNAGVSGDTAAMGLARLDRSVPSDADAVILELGVNDMHRGFEPSATRTALEAILRRLEARQITVLLCGARTHLNLPADYKRAFATMFSDLATEHDALFYPAFNDVFVEQAQLKLPDALHPTAAGIDAVVENIFPKVEELIDRVRRTTRKN
jgi:acyl-CoA thioesterase I